MAMPDPLCALPPAPPEEGCQPPARQAAAPIQPTNPPGLPAISYRIGDFNSFRRAMLDMVTRTNLLAGLLSGGQPPDPPNPFEGWHEGIAGDYHTALLELWAYLADVLTFYQERIANEAYVPTATQADSLHRLAELIGYRPAPVVAATTTLALTIAPDRQANLPAGLRVSSRAAPGEPATVFETGALAATPSATSTVAPLTALRRNQFALLSDYTVLAGLLILPMPLSKLPAAQGLVQKAVREVYGAASEAYLQMFGVESIVAQHLDTAQASGLQSFRTSYIGPGTGQQAQPRASSAAFAADVAQPSPALTPGLVVAVLEQGGAAGATLAPRTITAADSAAQLSFGPVANPQRKVVLDGINNRLVAGSYILVVENEDRAQQARYLRQLTAVSPDRITGTTAITWREEPGTGYGTDDPTTTIALYALRVRARPFGNQAPNWNTLPAALTGVAPVFPGGAGANLPPAVLAAAGLVPTNAPYAGKNWDDPANPWYYLPTPGDPSNVIYLDGIYGAVQGTVDNPGWVVLEAPLAWTLRSWTRVYSGQYGAIDGALSWTGDFAGTGGTQLLFFAAGAWRLASYTGEQFSITNLTDNAAGRGDPSSYWRWAGSFTGAVGPSGKPRTELLFFSTTDRTWWLGAIAAPGSTITWVQLSSTTNLTTRADSMPWPGELRAWAGEFAATGRLSVLLYKAASDEWWLVTVSLDSAGAPAMSLASLSSAIAGAAGTQSWQGQFTQTAPCELLIYDNGNQSWRLGAVTQPPDGSLSLAWQPVHSTLAIADSIAAGGRPIAGNFADPHQTTLLLYDSNGVWQLGRLMPDGSGGLTLSWLPAGTAPNPGVNVLTEGVWGNFSGDAHSQVLVYSNSDQNWRLAMVDGGQFSWTLAGDSAALGPLSDQRRFWSGAFSDPTRDDLLVYNPLDGAWWLANLAQTQPYQAYHVVDAQPANKIAYLLNSRVTRLVLDAAGGATETAVRFPLRGTTIHAAGERLTLHDVLPLPDHPVAGDMLILSGAYGALKAGQNIVVRGALIDPQTGQPGAAGAEPTTVAAPPIVDAATGLTTVRLARPLANRYARDGLTLLTHTVTATQGETVPDEVLGSGNGGAFQSFPLKRKPLVYLAAPGADGSSELKSTLQVTVNGERWAEQPTLLASLPHARHFVTTTDASGQTTVFFGDGNHGAIPPTGRDNVHASYRTGAGASGNAPAGSSVQLIDTVPGLQSVSSPLPASGGADMEGLEAIRHNAPASSRWAYGFAASAADYAALARGFAGVAKASAQWITRDAEAPGASRRPFVLLTVASGDGAALAAGLGKRLRAFMDAERDPNVELRLRDVTPIYLDVEATIDVLPLASRRDTLAATLAALASATHADGSAGLLALSRLEIGQDITMGAVYAALQAVPGVADATITRLCRAGTPRGSAMEAGDVAIKNGEIAVVKNDPADTADSFGKLRINLGQGGIADA